MENYLDGNCLSFEDNGEEIDDMFSEFCPPLDINLLPCFLNTALKWTQCIYNTNCIHAFANLIKKVDEYNLHHTDRKRIVHCLAEDCLKSHGADAYFGKECNHDDSYIF